MEHFLILFIVEFCADGVRLKAKVFLEIFRVVNLSGDFNGNEQNNL